MNSLKTASLQIDAVCVKNPNRSEKCKYFYTINCHRGCSGSLDTMKKMIASGTFRQQPFHYKSSDPQYFLHFRGAIRGLNSAAKIVSLPDERSASCQDQVEVLSEWRFTGWHGVALWKRMVLVNIRFPCHKKSIAYIYYLDSEEMIVSHRLRIQNLTMVRRLTTKM